MKFFLVEGSSVSVAGIHYIIPLYALQFFSERCISCGLPKAKSVLPIEPLNKVSPLSIMPSVKYTQLPGV